MTIEVHIKTPKDKEAHGWQNTLDWKIYLEGFVQHPELVEYNWWDFIKYTLYINNKPVSIK